MKNKRLQTRLEQLEKRARIDAPPQPIVCIKFVQPNGQFGGEVCYFDRASAHGRVWQIQPDETQAEFNLRVLRDLPSRYDSPTLVMFGDSKVGAVW